MSAGRAHTVAFGAVAAALLLFFAPALVGGGQFLYRDAGRHYHPVKQWLASEWRAGHYPEWNPHAGLGLPVVAGAIDAPQHPFNFFFLVLPFELAFSLWIVACYLLAAGGTMAWLRSLGAGAGPAAFGALAFALSGFMVSSSDNLIHLASMAAAPWLLAAVRRHGVRGQPGTLLAVGLASFLVAAGGELVDWGAAVILASALAFIPAVAPDEAARPTGREGARKILGALVASLVGAAPALLPFLAALPSSSRGRALDVTEAARWNLHPLRLVELFVPHVTRGQFGSIQNELYQRLTGDTVPTPWTLSLYLGAPVVALALFAAVRSAPGRWLVGAALAGLWVAMGSHAGFGSMASRVPILASVRYFERLAGWPTLLLSAAAALGALELLRPGRSARRPALAFGLAGASLLAFGLLVGLDNSRSAGMEAMVGGSPALAAALASNLSEGARGAGLALAVLAALAWMVGRGRVADGAPLLLVLLVGLDLAGANARAYLLAPPALVAARDAPIPAWLASRLDRPRITTPFALDRERWPELLPYESSWRWGARSAATSFQVAAGVRSLDTYAGVVPGRLDLFQHRVGTARRAAVAGLVGLAGVVVPHRLERAAELGLPPPWTVLAHDADLPAWLVAVEHRPRAYIAGPLTQVDPERALSYLASASRGLEGGTVLEGAVPDGYVPRPGSASVVRDDPDRVEVDVQADGPALLVLNDQFEAGWQVEVDGNAAAIVPANYLARGVWVGGGRHRVVFRYTTPLWREGWMVFSLGVLALGLAWRRQRLARPV